MQLKPLSCAVLVALLTAAFAASAEKGAPTEQKQERVQHTKSEAASAADKGKGKGKAAAASSEALVSDNDTVKGPAEIQLGEQGSFKLPEGMVFVKKDAANKMMQEWGNSTDPNRYGLVFPETKPDEDPKWFVDLSFVDAGYIKDDEARDWDVDAMLQNMREANEEQNKVRQSKGLPEIETHGWIEKPQYDAATHRLIWSIDAYEKNSKDNNPAVNYNAFQLGRKGYINLTLISDLKDIEPLKPLARDLLGRIEFKQGERYTDFDASSDKVAEYGLAALVGGVAAKKLGLFALLGALLAKFGKLVIVGLIALGAIVKRVFKGKNKDENQPPEA